MSGFVVQRNERLNWTSSVIRSCLSIWHWASPWVVCPTGGFTVSLDIIRSLSLKLIRAYHYTESMGVRRMLTVAVIKDNTFIGSHKWTSTSLPPSLSKHKYLLALEMVSVTKTSAQDGQRWTGVRTSGAGVELAGMLTDSEGITSICPGD